MEVGKREREREREREKERALLVTFHNEGSRTSPAGGLDHGVSPKN